MGMPYVKLLRPLLCSLCFYWLEFCSFFTICFLVRVVCITTWPGNVFLHSIFLLHVSRTGLGFVCGCACACMCFFSLLKAKYCLAFLCVKLELIISLWRFCSLVDISYEIEFCNLLLGFWKWEGISLGCSSSSSYIIKCPCPVLVIYLVMSREIELAKIWNYGQFAWSLQFHSSGVWTLVL